jgi:hypothetical protein
LDAETGRVSRNLDEIEGAVEKISGSVKENEAEIKEISRQNRLKVEEAFDRVKDVEVALEDKFSFLQREVRKALDKGGLKIGNEADLIVVLSELKNENESLRRELSELREDAGIPKRKPVAPVSEKRAAAAAAAAGGGDGADPAAPGKTSIPALLAAPSTLAAAKKINTKEIKKLEREKTESLQRLHMTSDSLMTLLEQSALESALAARDAEMEGRDSSSLDEEAGRRAELVVTARSLHGRLEAVKRMPVGAIKAGMARDLELALEALKQSAGANSAGLDASAVALISQLEDQVGAAARAIRAEAAVRDEATKTLIAGAAGDNKRAGRDDGEDYEIDGTPLAVFPLDVAIRRLHRRLRAVEDECAASFSFLKDKVALLEPSLGIIENDHKTMLALHEKTNEIFVVQQEQLMRGTQQEPGATGRQVAVLTGALSKLEGLLGDHKTRLVDLRMDLRKKANKADIDRIKRLQADILARAVESQNADPSLNDRTLATTAKCFSCERPLPPKHVPLFSLDDDSDSDRGERQQHQQQQQHSHGHGHGQNNMMSSTLYGSAHLPLASPVGSGPGAFAVSSNGARLAFQRAAFRSTVADNSRLLNVNGGFSVSPARSQTALEASITFPTIDAGLGIPLASPVRKKGMKGSRPKTAGTPPAKGSRGGGDQQQAGDNVDDTFFITSTPQTPAHHQRPTSPVASPTPPPPPSQSPLHFGPKSRASSARSQIRYRPDD